MKSIKNFLKNSIRNMYFVWSVYRFPNIQNRFSKKRTRTIKRGKKFNSIIFVEFCVSMCLCINVIDSCDLIIDLKEFKNSIIRLTLIEQIFGLGSQKHWYSLNTCKRVTVLYVFFSLLFVWLLISLCVCVCIYVYVYTMVVYVVGTGWALF